MLAMVMHKGVQRRAKKGFEQGEWTFLCNCDQTVIGLILVKSTSRDSEAHVRTLAAEFAHWRQCNLQEALMKGEKNNLAASLEALKSLQR